MNSHKVQQTLSVDLENELFLSKVVRCRPKYLFKMLNIIFI